MVCTVFCLAGCQRAAPPVAVSNQPVSINDKPTTNDRPASNERPIVPDKPFAEMSWTDQKNKVQKLSELKGKAVILDFWATFCAPCKKEIPHLNSLLAKYGKDNLHIVGLNVGGDEDVPKIPAFIAETKLSYPVAFPEDDLSRVIFAERDDIPQTAVFDRNGRMLTKFIGYGPEVEKKLEEAVAKAVASEPPA